MPWNYAFGILACAWGCCRNGGAAGRWPLGFPRCSHPIPRWGMPTPDSSANALQSRSCESFPCRAKYARNGIDDPMPVSKWECRKIWTRIPTERTSGARKSPVGAKPQTVRVVKSSYTPICSWQSSKRRARMPYKARTAGQPFKVLASSAPQAQPALSFAAVWRVVPCIRA